MPCCRYRKNTGGFTLLEVVVGLVIMAGVLVASLMAFSAHRRTRQFANAKLAAVSIADELLTRFSGSTGGIPAGGRGPIAGRPTWRWQSQVIGATAPADVPMNVLRFQIVEVTMTGQSRTLVSVDLVEGLR